MITIRRDDETLDDLLGSTIRSEVSPGVGYRLVGRAGAGAMFASYYAVRASSEGDCPVVLKVLRPSFCRQLGDSAAFVVKKEAVSLGRLNERVPPTPFVVRLFDTGTCSVRGAHGGLALPWISVEYVHGGAQGTTLHERVQRSIASTGYAFDPSRAERAIDCITRGLAAVHEVGVIHRDVTPATILCCGAGEDEILKLSDFGLARPQGIKETLGVGLLSPVGIGAPELLSSAPGAVGPWTDLFSVSSVIYFLLTGEPYFTAKTLLEGLNEVSSRSRRSVLDGRWLHPTLRADEAACRSIDFALRWATTASVDERLQEAEALAAMLSPYLHPAPTVPLLTTGSVPPGARTLPIAREGSAPDFGPETLRAVPRNPSCDITLVRAPAASPSDRTGARATLASSPDLTPTPAPSSSDMAQARATLPSTPRREAPAVALQIAPPSATLEGELEPSRPTRSSSLDTAEDRASLSRSADDDRWTWSTLHHPGSTPVLRSLSWDGYGRCLAASGEGLLFWNGMTWCAATSDHLAHPTGLRFVHRIAAGRWLVGGDASTLAVYTTGGVTGVLQRPGDPEQYTALSGDLEDMGVLAAAPAEGPPLLHTFIGRRWLRPLSVGGATYLASIARVEDERWLVAARTSAGRGMLALYSPLNWTLERLAVPDVRAFMACAGRTEARVGIAVGADGAVVWRTERGLRAEFIDPRRDLSAVSLGPDGSAWVASAGRIWRRRPSHSAWQCLWSEDAWLGPIVSLFVDSDVVVAVSADGGILEGRPVR